MNVLQAQKCIVGQSGGESFEFGFECGNSFDEPQQAASSRYQGHSY